VSSSHKSANPKQKYNFDLSPNFVSLHPQPPPPTWQGNKVEILIGKKEGKNEGKAALCWVPAVWPL
jgi:hypothetical protein